MAVGGFDRIASTLRTADVVILTGDLTNFGEPTDAARVVAAARRHCPVVLAVTGNLDMPWVIDALRADGVSLHGAGRRLGSLGIFGCGGSNETPMDTPTEFPDDELGRILETAHAPVADAPCRLMICHTPPFGTAVDRLVNGTPVGSAAVRAFIERRGPDVAVVGHVHEGRGIDRIGATTVVNPGAFRDGGYAILDYDDTTRRLTPRLERFDRAIVL